VGLSYAGEDQALVAPAAAALARCFGWQRALFDQDHQAELARPDLDVYLPMLYQDKTELIVVLRLGDPGDPSEISARIPERTAQQGIKIPEAADPGMNSSVATLLVAGR
jgi:hypothetical protein